MTRSTTTKAMTWATVAAAVASAFLVAASGAGRTDRLAHESRSVLRQIGIMPRAADRRDAPNAAAPARDPALRSAQP